MSHKHRPPMPPNLKPHNHTNAFVDLNGVPYLLGEYLDRTQFRQIDRSIIKSDLFVDQTEAMRAVVDISINDIGQRSDGYPNIIGNNTKHRNLLAMVARHANRLQHRLDVMKSGIIVRINYRLENQRTKQVIRSTTEDLRIPNRNYFLDINPRDINDNAIIINFSDSIVSTLNEFTHGIDRMIIRITSIQMFYEVLRRDMTRKSAGNSAIWATEEFLPDYEEYDDPYYYRYQSEMQNQHYFHPRNDAPMEAECVNPIYPPTWLMVNRFYRFDNMAQDVILHTSEIYDPNNRILLIPCGSVQVNRQFLINPGHRIIFKLSIWKNDLTSVSNTQRVAQALGAQCIDSNFPPCNCNPEPCEPPPHHHGPHTDERLNLEKLLLLLAEQNNASISDKKLMKLLRLIKELTGGAPIMPPPHHPHPPVCPPPPPPNCPHCGCYPCICPPPIDDDECCCLPLSNDKISEILDGF